MFLKCSILLLLLGTMTSAKLIIIGTGPSGIAAATRLLENNYTDFIVLEAENRIGGRINTVKFGANVQDLGAQWCHGEVNNVVFELAQPLGLLEHSKFTFTNMEYINSKGEFLPKGSLNKITTHFEEFPEIKNAPLNVTVGDYIIQVYKKYVTKEEFNILDQDVKDSMLDFLHLKQKPLEACDSWFELPMKAELEYDDKEGNQLNSWKGKGYRTILDVLMKKIPDPTQELPLKDKIQLNKEVVNINWDSGSDVKVKCKDGSTYEAERVLITTSLGVLKAQHETLFTPHLPSFKIDAIEGIGFGTVNKLVFEFPYPWWNNETEGFLYIWSKLDQSPEVQQLFKEYDWLKYLLGFHPYDYQPNNLLGWLVGDAARKMETVDENIVKEKLMSLMRLMLGKHYEIPEPVNFVRTQWYSNPHFRGSYSYNSVLGEKLNTSNLELARPIRNSKNIEVLQFAGEATNSYRFSTVDGAIETGWREADRILKNIQ